MKKNINKILRIPMQKAKGFTLIELLIVIGILAILAVVTVLVLNPAELFRQARDSQRLSDLGSVKGAISLYLTTVQSPLVAPGTAGNVCGTNYWGTITGATENFSGTPAQSSQTGRAVDGSGWVPVALSTINGGSPLPTLPVDPINPNTAARSYTYQCNASNLTFELNADMESSRYQNGGSDDVENTDGGNVSTIYEVGTSLSL
jgi:prepilin-type N-terminal cleavage/methylation domain-containing protein